MKNRWSDEEANGMSDLELIAYASRLMGQEEDLVIVGGGNSSVKVIEPDPITKRVVEVVYVKASGFDMKSITPAGFAPIRRSRIKPVMKLDTLTDVGMMEYGRLALQDPKASDPSVEYLLHVVLDDRFILHSHADKINALTDQPPEIAARNLSELYGPNFFSVPFIMPGFPLAKAVAKALRNRRGQETDYIFLEKHGLFTAAKTAKAAYTKHIDMVSVAEDYAKSKLNGRHIFSIGDYPAPASEAVARTALNIRGSLGTNPRFIVKSDNSPEVMAFANSDRAKDFLDRALATPDHVIRTKGVALLIEPDVAQAHEGAKKSVQASRDKYVAYFARYNSENLRMLDPNPAVIVVPTIGTFYVGKTAKDVSDIELIWRHTLSAMEAAEAIGKFETITEQERHKFEYWELEQRKLGKTAPLPLAGKVAMVTGAYGGIGSAIARKLAKEGAAVVLVDVDPRVRSLEQEINKYFSATAEVADLTNEASVARVFECAALQYGGLDILVSSVATIGNVAKLRDFDVNSFEKTSKLNELSAALVLKYGLRLLEQQGIGGHIINISTKNVGSPGADFGEYSSTKSSAHQFYSVGAIEGAPDSIEASSRGIRVNQVAPDAIFDTGLWKPEVMETRAKTYGVPVEKLADFYQERNLLKVRLSAEDVANAVFAAEVYFPKTTGHTFRVDGGLKEFIGR